MYSSKYIDINVPEDYWYDVFNEIRYKNKNYVSKGWSMARGHSEPFIQCYETEFTPLDLKEVKEGHVRNKT